MVDATARVVAFPAALSASADPITPHPLHGTRVLIATESLGPVNGVTRATTSLRTHLATHQIATVTLAPETGTAADHDFDGTIRLPGLPIPYNPELRVVRPFDVHELFRRVGRPDVIYLASPATLGFQLWWQARRFGIPIVANYQTDLATYARMVLPRPTRRVLGWSADQATARLYRDDAVRLAFVPSSQSRAYLVGLGVPETKLRLLGRGVDCALFHRAKRSADVRQQLAPNGELLLLCVSRLSFEKGFDLLAAAYREIVARARARGITRPFRLIITGGNANPTIEAEIRRYFNGLDVHFTGMLTGEALATMYASADAFVFPSQSETFGQVVQEAMASGLPVVAQRAGGPADLVVPGQTGTLVPAGDVAAFADAIATMIADDLGRARMGRVARAVAEHRSWDAINLRISHTVAEAVRQSPEGAGYRRSGSA